MRATAIVVLLLACDVYDPVDDLSFREYPDTKMAVSDILGEVGRPHVFAIGEYHATSNSRGRSPLTRFTDEVIGLLEPYARHLIVETWYDDCGESSIQPQVSAATGRPASTAVELQQLAKTSQKLSITTRGLSITCLENQAMRDPTGKVDFLHLLELVTEKLADTTRRVLAGTRTRQPTDRSKPNAGDEGVIVYGGALHNDLFPRWPLDGLSYAAPLAKELGGGVLELDLIVPEVVAPMALVRAEPWFPLLNRASPHRVIVWKRGTGSYVIILPALTEAVAKIAPVR